MGDIDRLKWIKAAVEYCDVSSTRVFKTLLRDWFHRLVIWPQRRVLLNYKIGISHDIYLCGQIKCGLYSNEPKWYCSSYLFQSSTEVVYNYYVSFSMFHLTGQLCQLLLLTILMDWMPILVVSTKDLYYSLFSLRCYDCIFILTFWGNS